MQYPLVEEVDSNPFTQTRDAHEAFLKSRSETAIGRDDLLQEVNYNIIVFLFHCLFAGTVCFCTVILVIL